MKKSSLLAACLALILMAAAPAAAADDPAARAVMEKVDARDEGDNQASDMEMILIDKRGNQRLRRIRSFAKERGPDRLRLMFFQHPADVKDTGFLTWDYDAAHQDDDQWLYLPALRKTKRIASSDKSGSFMGSDLNYSDMTSRTLEDFDFGFYAKQKEAEVDGHRVLIVEALPRSPAVIDETGYKRSLLFVRPDIDFVVRAINWEKRGGYLKYMEVKRLEQIDGIWVSTEMHVKRNRGKKTVHRTILRLSNVRFNQPLEEDFFSVPQLEKGF